MGQSLEQAEMTLADARAAIGVINVVDRQPVQPPRGPDTPMPLAFGPTQAPDRLVLPADDVFSPGSARLRPEAKPLMAEIAEAILAWGAARTDGAGVRGWRVEVQGHADGRPYRSGNGRTNFSLSSDRAVAVVEALNQSGVAMDRLLAVGYGATAPLAIAADEDDAAAHRQNRRVEFVLKLE